MMKSKTWATDCWHEDTRGGISFRLKHKQTIKYLLFVYEQDGEMTLCVPNFIDGKHDFIRVFKLSVLDTYTERDRKIIELLNNFLFEHARLLDVHVSVESIEGMPRLVSTEVTCRLSVCDFNRGYRSSLSETCVGEHQTITAIEAFFGSLNQLGA